MALDALEKFVQHATFACIGRNEVKDEAVLFLAVTVDAAHALFQPDGIPRDVVIDHQPAELEIDAFAGRFGGDEHLGSLAKLALGDRCASRACRGRRSSCRRESA